jgi:hypothetical protein
VAGRPRTIQRLEKVLQALLSGVSDPEQLAVLSKGGMRAKIPQLRERGKAAS